MSSCRGSRPRPRPRPLRPHLLHPPLSTCTFPPRLLPAPRPPTPLPSASNTSWRSTPPRRTHQTPTQLCQLTPTRQRRPSIPTPTRHHRGHGSSYLCLIPHSLCAAVFLLKTLKEHAKRKATGTSWRTLFSLSYPCFLLQMFANVMFLKWTQKKCRN